MNRSRLAIALGIVLAFGVTFTFVQGRGKRIGIYARVMDRRCRGGCSGSTPQALLAILPGSGTVPLAQQCTGALLTQKGATVTVTRASSKYCTKSDGTMVLLSNDRAAVEANGLSVEGGATQLLQQSNVFSNAAWTTENVTLTNNVTGPTGVANTAWTMTDNAVNGNHRIYQPFSTGSAPVVGSVYARAGTASFIGISGVNTSVMVYDLSACTVSSSANGTASTVALGATGWCRVIDYVPASGAFNIIITMGDTAAHALGPNNTYVGTGRTIQLFIAQVENNTYASSPVESTTGSVTRAADVPSVANPTAGTQTICAGADITNMCTWTDTSHWIPVLAFGGSNGAANYSAAYIQPNGGTSNILVYGTYDSGGTAKSFTYDTVTPLSNAKHRYAVCNAAGIVSMSLDGSAVTPSSSGSGTGVVTVPATMYPGVFDTGGTGAPGVWLSNIVVDTTMAKVK